MKQSGIRGDKKKMSRFGGIFAPESKNHDKTLNTIKQASNKRMSKKTSFKNLGLTGYKTAWDYQQNLFDRTLAIKLANEGHHKKTPTSNYLLFCEHNPVYTLGKNGSLSNLLIDEKQLNQKGAEFYHINRGGDITYHGPGQITGYPVLDLDNFGLSIKDYIFGLEEVMIRTLGQYGIIAGRSNGETGVWLDTENPAKARKIGAIGARISKLVTMHGFALNVNTDLSFYDYIIPCGITGKGVTSMEKELGKKVDLDEVQDKLLSQFEEVFGMDIDR